MSLTVLVPFDPPGFEFEKKVLKSGNYHAPFSNVPKSACVYSSEKAE